MNARAQEVGARASFVFGRALPLGFFAFLVAIQGELAVGAVQNVFPNHMTRAATMYLLNRLLTLTFFTFLVVIYAVRGRAVAKNHTPWAVIAAFVGTFVLYTMWLLPVPRTTNLWVLAVADTLLAAGMLLAIYSLSYLRLRFSIVPEARGLVRSGPYGLVRHPIYLGEIISAIGLVLPSLASYHLGILLVFIGAQICRTFYEERVLRQAFPEYASYARHTARIIPYLF